MFKLCENIFPAPAKHQIGDNETPDNSYKTPRKDTSKNNEKK